MNNSQQGLQNKQLLQTISFQSNTIYCSQKNISKSSCMNKNCQKHPFVCSNIQCNCRNSHKKCLIIQLEGMTQTIMSKIITLKPIEDMICQKIQATINELSDFRDKMISMLRQKWQYCGLTELEINLLQGIKNGKVENITGKLLWTIHSNLQENQLVDKIKAKFQQNVNKIWQKIDKYVSKNTQSIVKEYQVFKKKLNGDKKIQSSNYGLFDDSKVIVTEQDNIKLVNFFTFGNIASTNLLYRASENQFSVQKFHEKCDDIPNTLFVFQTQFGKILGSFTPCKYQSTGSQTWATDTQLKSFLFSLTQNQKFKSTVTDKTLCNCVRYGPTLGYYCVYTCDKANITQSSYFQVATGYENSKFRQNSSQSHLLLIGNPNNSYNYRIKQWQIWQIQFQQQI